MLQPTPQAIHVTRPARLAPYEYHLRPRTEFRNARSPSQPPPPATHL